MYEYMLAGCAGGNLLLWLAAPEESVAVGHGTKA